MKPIPAIYNWLNCKAAPGHATRAFIVEATGIPESALLPRSMVQAPALPSRRLWHHPPGARLKDVLGFNVDSDGMATITLHARLPLDTATPLLRMILMLALSLRKENEMKNRHIVWIARVFFVSRKHITKRLKMA